jgi:transglutaminase-like putative cysteine protease/ubiquinone/menaquinone biosynthesis C-methylase UbiE
MIRRIPLLLLLSLVAAAPATTTTAPVYETRLATRDGTGRFYMGREIAQVMGHQAADWLERPEREAEEGTQLLVDNMDLRPTDVCADIGAGTGYFSFRMAAKVAQGKVLAVDIQQEMLDLLAARAKKLGIANVEPVLGAIDDPKLPPAGVDVALIVDAYHEFSNPREMMDGIVRGLRPGGRLVLVEYRAEDPNVPIKPLHKMTEAQARREMAAVGLEHVDTKSMLPRQHLMIFRKPAERVGSTSMQTEDSTGASLAFTSSDPIVKQVLSLMDGGQFKQAQSLLASDDGHANAEVERAREETKEIVRRTLREYSLDAAGLLEKVKKDIPDATAADLEKWTKAGEVQTRTIDGKLMYFRREPSNLFRFSAEAKQRKEANAKPEEKTTDWTLLKHLSNVVAEADKTGKAEVLPIRHRIDYSVTIPPNTKGAKKGSQIRVWLPLPQEYRKQQTDVKILKISPELKDVVIAPNGSMHRTVCFTHTMDDPAKELKYELAFEYTSSAYYPVLKDELVKPLAADFDRQYLSERLPHIAFTPQLKAKVAEIIGDEANPLAKARKIFHWIDANIKYHAEEEYGVIPSFSGACLTRGRGDCGVQAILFITMCRAAGVPARWQSGWETKPAGWNMHDWAEFYVEPWGWLPADPSYGVQSKSDDPRVRDFYIGHQDSYRLIVNLDYGRPLVPPKQSLRSEPADFQKGEVEIDGRNLYYDDWDYEFAPSWLTPE